MISKVPQFFGNLWFIASLNLFHRNCHTSENLENFRKLLKIKDYSKEVTGKEILISALRNIELRFQNWNCIWICKLDVEQLMNFRWFEVDHLSITNYNRFLSHFIKILLKSIHNFVQRLSQRNIMKNDTLFLKVRPLLTILGLEDLANHRFWFLFGQ